MNNWLAQIRTRSQLKHIPALMRRLLTAKRHTASYAGSIFHVSPVAEWQQAVSSTACPHLPFTPPIAVYSCSIKLFHLKIALGQILAAACATTETHSCPESTFAHFRWKAFRRQTYINHLHDVNSWIKFRLYNNSFAPALGGACAKGTNAMALIQAIRSSQAAFLCTADKLQCGPMLAHNGTYWLMLAFSFLHISFIGTKASVVLF